MPALERERDDDDVTLATDPTVLATVERLTGRARASLGRGVAVELAGQRVTFRSDRPEGARIVRTIFGPYCALGDAGTGAGGPPHGHWQVASAKLDDLPAAVDDLVRSITAAGGAPVPVKRWGGDDWADRYDIAPGRAVVVHRRPFTGVTAFSAADRELWYLRPDDAFDVPHTEHAVKYPLRVTLRQAGFSQVHAAGCRFRGRGLLLMGQRRAGKTTLLMNLMSAGADFVSNDLSYVHRTPGGGCRMIAFPHMTRIAHGTIGDNDLLRAALDAEERTGDYLRSPVFNGGKEEFYFPVLRRMWGRDPICRDLPLDVVIFPALDTARSDAVAQRLPAEEAGRRIHEALVDDPPLPDWLPYMSDAEFRALAVAAADGVVACGPAAYELRFGPRHTAPAAAVERLLAELDRGRSAGAGAAS